MNKHHDDRSKLLAETFLNDWTEGAPAHFAHAAAAHARFRRRVRRATALAAAIVVVAAIAFVVTPHERTPPTPVAAANVAPKPAPRGYEIISDEELLNQLRDRPLFVVKTQSGHNQVVVLETAPLPRGRL
jgi:hypothetical protein